MADYTQEQKVVLAQQALVNAADSAMLVGGDIDVRTYLSGVVTIFRGNIEAVANLTAGLAFIELQKSADGVDWSTVQRFVPSGGTVTLLDLDATCDAGQKVLTSATVAIATMTAGKWIYVHDAGTVANGEFHMIADSAVNDTVTLVDNLAVAKAATDYAHDVADVWPYYMDFAGCGYIRVVACNGGASGPDWVLKASLMSATDLE
jgi:hypothetical protein